VHGSFSGSILHMHCNYCFLKCFIRLCLQERMPYRRVPFNKVWLTITFKAVRVLFRADRFYLDHSKISDTEVSYKKKSMVWVRERTIPTERPPLVGEVIANFCG
jgi:hypothetical protein